MNEAKRMRAVFEAKLEAIELPVPFKIETFCEAIGRYRGRSLRLIAMSAKLGDHTFGLWVETDEEDVILYQEDAAPLHRDVIVLHETAHMLLGHQPDLVMSAEDLKRVLPTAEPGLVHTMLARRVYDSQQEQDAEALATLLVERSSHQHQRSNACDRWIKQLNEALQNPRRHSA